MYKITVFLCLQVKVMMSLNKLCAKKMTYLKMGKIIIIKYIYIKYKLK